MRHLIAAAALIALTACDGKGPGTSISISGDNGQAALANGVATIDLPGIKGSVKLPRIQIDASDVDLDGAKLYPGSKVSGMSITAGDKTAGGDRIHITFESPAGVAAVRDHLRKSFADSKYRLTESEGSLAGTGPDGQALRVTLTPQGAAATKGDLLIGK